MPITYKYNEAVLSSYFLDLDVVVENSGTSIKVPAGSFTIEGEPRILDEDWEWDLPTSRSHSLTVLGYLVQDKESGDIQVLVDEFWNDGEDELFIFENSSPYKLLVELYGFTIQPTDPDDLNLVDIWVRRSKEWVPRSEPEAPPPEPPEEG
jgi:hypothetical protein